MKYTTEILVGAPLDVCIGKFDLLSIKHWQHNLDLLEHIYGISGECGAKMKLNYKNGRNPMSIVETITPKICLMNSIGIMTQKVYTISRKIILRQLLKIVPNGGL